MSCTKAIAVLVLLATVLVHAPVWATGTLTDAAGGTGGGGGDGAPTDSTYITQTADSTLSAEQALGALSTGCLGVTTTTGSVASRTITGTSNEISVSNGNCSGNPTLSLPSSIDLGGKSVEIPNSGTLPGTCTVGQVYQDTSASSGAQWYLCETTDTWVVQGGGLTSEADTLDTVFDRGKVIDGANSLANAVRIGDGTTPWCIYTDASDGPILTPCTDSNVRTRIPTDFTWALRDVEGAADIVTVDPDAASKNAMYQFGTNYRLLASLSVPLSPRGAATMTETSIVANQPKSWWGTLTDVDTDAFDFYFPITKKMEGATTATVRLVGVSDHASPSGNVQLHCAMKAYRPGTDTYGAHDTTGEQAVTLTPATQNRPVGATSAAITINGTVADGGEMIGSCEVSASGTTSAQLTDFFLRGFATIQFLVNSWSD
jgi:hypothetical protein